MTKADVVAIADSEYGSPMIEFCLGQSTLTHRHDLLAAAIGQALVEGTEDDTGDANRLSQAVLSLDRVIERVRDVKDALVMELERLQ